MTLTPHGQLGFTLNRPVLTRETLIEVITAGDSFGTATRREEEGGGEGGGGSYNTVVFPFCPSIFSSLPLTETSVGMTILQTTMCIL